MKNNCSRRVLQYCLYYTLGLNILLFDQKATNKKYSTTFYFRGGKKDIFIKNKSIINFQIKNIYI